MEIILWGMAYLLLDLWNFVDVIQLKADENEEREESKTNRDPFPELIISLLLLPSGLTVVSSMSTICTRPTSDHLNWGHLFPHYLSPFIDTLDRSIH